MDCFLPDGMKIKNNPYAFFKYTNSKRQRIIWYMQLSIIYSMWQHFSILFWGPSSTANTISIALSNPSTIHTRSIFSTWSSPLLSYCFSCFTPEPSLYLRYLQSTIWVNFSSLLSDTTPSSSWLFLSSSSSSFWMIPNCPFHCTSPFSLQSKC